MTVFDLRRRVVDMRLVLHPHLEADDHNVPALLALQDGRILAVYSRHGSDKLIRYRVTERSGDPFVWLPEEHVKRDAPVTYSNLFLLSAENEGQGCVYNFYRGQDANPNYVVSQDQGRSWRYGARLVVFKGRPYVKYASNNIDTIHFITTEHHPNNWDNSIYHAYLRRGILYRSDGRRIQPVDAGGIRPDQATCVFSGDEKHVAWTVDLHIDSQERPRFVYSVQRDGNPEDLCYRYARWDGQQWHDHALAHAGTALYEREADYSGLAALDPQDPNVVYFSADADPATGKPLISRADDRRHYEIFRGITQDGGVEWTFTPITKDSTVDNLRPIVPIGQPMVLLWLRGTYTSYTDYDLDVVALIDP